MFMIIYCRKLENKRIPVGSKALHDISGEEGRGKNGSGIPTNVTACILHRCPYDFSNHDCSHSQIAPILREQRRECFLKSSFTRDFLTIPPCSFRDLGRADIGQVAERIRNEQGTFLLLPRGEGP